MSCVNLQKQNSMVRLTFLKNKLKKKQYLQKSYISIEQNYVLFNFKISTNKSNVNMCKVNVFLCSKVYKDSKISSQKLYNPILFDRYSHAQEDYISVAMAVHFVSYQGVKQHNTNQRATPISESEFWCNIQKSYIIIASFYLWCWLSVSALNNNLKSYHCFKNYLWKHYVLKCESLSTSTHNACRCQWQCKEQWLLGLKNGRVEE